MWLLSQYKLTKSLLPDIKQSLNEFVQQTEVLYGKEQVRINVHQLLHIVKDVKLWGLLWTHNSFIYESMNGILTKFIHGTKKVPTTAIASLFNMQQIWFKEISVTCSHLEVVTLMNKFQRTQKRYILIEY